MSGVADALAVFLDRRELAGADLVRAALARRLAEAVDDVPAYALPRLAGALANLLGELGEAAEGEHVAAGHAERILAEVTR